MVVDIVFPQNNEREFISVAERLGCKGLIFVYERDVDVKKVKSIKNLNYK